MLRGTGACFLQAGFTGNTSFRQVICPWSVGSRDGTTVRFGNVLSPPLFPGPGGGDYCPQILPNAKNIRIPRVTKDQLKNKDVRTEVGNEPKSVPGIQVQWGGEMARSWWLGYSLSDIYIIHNLSNVKWLPSGKVLLALGGIKPTLLISLLGQI